MKIDFNSVLTTISILIVIFIAIAGGLIRFISLENKQKNDSKQFANVVRKHYKYIKLLFERDKVLKNELRQLKKEFEIMQTDLQHLRSENSIANTPPSS